MSGRRAPPEQLDLLDWIAAQPPCPAPTVPGPPMAEPAPVLLTRVEAFLNMRRFYGLALAASLFGEWGVVRRWGRIGGQGQVRTDWHGAHEVAATERNRIERSKRRRGLRVGVGTTATALQ